jgi:FkbM family methyltransferase
VLFDFAAAVKTTQLPMGRVVHVGGHRGQEGEIYKTFGSQVIWFEPLLECAASIQARYPHDTVIPAACAETWGVRTLHVANNEQSSSLLAPKEHLIQHPEVGFHKTITVVTVPLDAVVTQADGLVMDVQGAEQMVLDGAPKLLQTLHWVCAEVNRAELYAGCAHIETLDATLKDFNRVITVWRAGKDWGDALWVKK